MAVIYIPDTLGIEAHACANEGFPDAPEKEAMERRNAFVKAAVREKLDRDKSGRGDNAGTGI